jgi:hypothetical protein
VWFGTALAILTKEPAVALTVALVAISLKEKKWRDALLYASTVLPFIGWLLYLKFHLPPNKEAFGMLKNFTWPYMGALSLIPSEIKQILQGENERVFMLRIGSRLWLVAASIAVFVIALRHHTFVSFFAVLAGINVAILSCGEEAPCYDYMTHFARQAFLFPPALFFLYLETKKPSLKWLLIVLVFITLSAYYMMIKGKFV